MRQGRLLDLANRRIRPDGLLHRRRSLLGLGSIVALLLGACDASRGSGPPGDGGGLTLLPLQMTVSGPLTANGASVTLTGTTSLGARPPCREPVCTLELSWDVVLSQMGTALPARRFSGAVPLRTSGPVSFEIPWDGTRDAPTGAAAPDDVYRADARVRVVEHVNGVATTLATSTTAGASPARFALVEVARFNTCEGCGRDPLTVPMGTELSCPLVEGTDLGQPASGDPEGFPGVAMIFGDAAGGVFQGALPQAAGTFVPMLSEPSSFLDAAGNPLPGNDDVLAWLGTSGSPVSGADSCGLGLAFAGQGGNIAPVTMNGPYGDGSGGGTFLGGLGVPGSPFFAGSHLFALMNDAQGTSPNVLLWWLTCATDADCPSGDRCLPRPLLAQDGTTAGTFLACVAHGACSDPSDPASPCFLRARPRRLGASSPASPEAFVTPGVDAIADPAAAAPYPAEFALTSAFVDPGPPRTVYVFGRESLDGVRGTWSSAVHLLRHTVGDDGRLGPSEIFVGCAENTARDGSVGTEAGLGSASSSCGGAQPVFAWGAKPATLYDEEKSIVTNTRSVVFVPGIGKDARGLYLMVYGGRRPASFLTGPARLAQPTLTLAAIGDELSGIYVRTAPHPWGPWSATKTIFSPFSAVNDGYCRSMHYDPGGPAQNPLFSCASGAEATNGALARNPIARNDTGAEYGAGILPHLVRVVNGDAGQRSVVFDWVLSTWNPYGVVLMRTTLGLAPGPRGASLGAASERTENAIRSNLGEPAAGQR